MEKYVACKHRNVAAAYDRFLGPSAGALPEPWHSRTWSGLLQALRLRQTTAPTATPRALRVES